jgi:hypothetical protein
MATQPQSVCAGGEAYEPYIGRFERDGAGHQTWRKGCGLCLRLRRGRTRRRQFGTSWSYRAGGIGRRLPKLLVPAENGAVT